MLFSKGHNLVFLYFFILFIFFASFVSAIGLSPADVYINFVPDYSFVIDYSVTSYRPFDFYVQGEFSEFARIETISQDDNHGDFRVYLDLPSDYDPPGKHKMFVAAKERAMPGTVNAIAVIRGFVEIDVPYPGHYAEMDITVENVNQGVPVPISVDVRNKGKLNITDAKVSMSVISGDSVVKTMNSETVMIEVGGGYAFQYTIPAGELKPGKYSLGVRLSYEQNKKEKSADFRVGKFDVAIVNYTNKMWNGSVNLFEIDVESLWNNRIDTVYMDLNIKNDSKVVSSVKTPPFDLLPWQVRKSSFYWNTEMIPVGTYDLEILLHYDEGVKTENRKIYIVENKPAIEEKPVPISTIMLVAIALILVIFNIYFILSRKKEKKEEREKK